MIEVSNQLASVQAAIYRVDAKIDLLEQRLAKITEISEVSEFPLNDKDLVGIELHTQWISQLADERKDLEEVVRILSKYVRE